MLSPTPTRMPTTTGSTQKTICPPPPMVGNIICHLLNMPTEWWRLLKYTYLHTMLCSLSYLNFLNTWLNSMHFSWLSQLLHGSCHKMNVRSLLKSCHPLLNPVKDNLSRSWSFMVQSTLLRSCQASHLFILFMISWSICTKVMRLCWDLTCDPGSAAKYATDCPMELDLHR